MGLNICIFTIAIQWKFCLIHVSLENVVRLNSSEENRGACTPTMNTDSRGEIIIRRKEGSYR